MAAHGIGIVVDHLKLLPVDYVGMWFGRAARGGGAWYLLMARQIVDSGSAAGCGGSGLGRNLRNQRHCPAAHQHHTALSALPALRSRLFPLCLFLLLLLVLVPAPTPLEPVRSAASPSTLSANGTCPRGRHLHYRRPSEPAC
jgi:hypothetical protein